MKLEDLMLGNWVLVDGKPTRVYSIEPEGINIKFDGDVYDTCTFEDEIEPLPITEEILENNFTPEGKSIYVIFDKEDIGERMAYSIDAHYLYYRPFKSAMCRCTEIKYVHELQNFLKIMKIDKKIEI